MKEQSHYSHAPILRFPEFKGKWEKKKLGNFSTWASGGTPPKDNPAYWNGDIPWISASSMRGLEYSDSDLKITNEGLKKGSKLAKKGSLLILVRGSMLFNKIPIGITAKDVAFNQDVKSIEINQDSSSKFILNWFSAFEPKILNLVTGTGIGAGKMDLSDLKKLEISLPTDSEQQKIASFFSSIDKKISQLTEKSEQLVLYKKGIAQKLFSQEIRFKDEDGKEFPDWEFVPGNKIFDSVSNKNHQSDLPILAISQDFGAIPRELIDYQISVTDKSIEGYKVVEKGDFIISLRSFQGGIEYSDYHGICSPAYIILRPNVDLNRTFYKYYFKTPEYIKILNSKLEGIRDGKMISYKYFSEFYLPFPCSDEQNKIANLLTSIDQKINQVKSQIGQAKEWKKGLLQKMFV